VVTQIPRANQFLPALPVANTGGDANLDYIFEPSKQEIVSELIPKALKIEFYKALLESNASEHGARMSAMDKATENAEEILKELKLTYNRSRQAAITKEILEIVGGAEALSNG
jgi:F-type H+-transporting ATPase subunit gamma